MRRVGRLAAAVAVVLAGTSCTGASTPEAREALTGADSFLVRVDESGALVMDAPGNALVGVDRALGQVWASQDAVDRRYIMCISRCPDAVASGVYPIEEGVPPEPFQIWADNGPSGPRKVSRESAVLWSNGRQQVRLITADDGGSTLLYNRPGGGQTTLRTGADALWLTNSDKDLAVLTTTTEARRMERQGSGWVTKTIHNGDASNLVYCLDSERVVNVDGTEVLLDGRIRFRSGLAEPGFCSINGDSLVLASFSWSPPDGFTTTVEVWSVNEADLLWRRVFNFHGRPSQSPVSGSTLHRTGEAEWSELDSAGRVIREFPNTANAAYTAAGTVVALRVDGRVDWIA